MLSDDRRADQTIQNPHADLRAEELWVLLAKLLAGQGLQGRIYAPASG